MFHGFGKPSMVMAIMVIAVGTAEVSFHIIAIAPTIASRGIQSGNSVGKELRKPNSVNRWFDSNPDYSQTF